MAIGETTQYRNWIGRLDAGDGSALNEMLAHFQDRLLHLSHLMLRRFPTVKRWEESGDVFLEAMLRLEKAIEKVSPASPSDFLRLAARQIRWELLDLAKVHRRDARPSQVGCEFAQGDHEPKEAADGTDGPGELATWTEFHEKAGAMPPELSEVFALIWYDGLTQKEAAAILNLSERTIGSRWIKARLALRKALGGQLPGRW